MLRNFLTSFALLYLTSSLYLPLAFASPYGTCKTLTYYTPVHFFEVDKFVGKWHLREWYFLPDGNVSIPETRCHTWNLGETSQPKIVALDYKYIIPGTGEGTVVGVANYTTENGVFPLDSVWSLVGGEEQTPVSPYSPIIWMQTDYTNWAVGYFCQNMDLDDDNRYSLETMVLFTRDPMYDDDKILNLLHTVIENYGYSAQYMSPVDNANCT